MQIPVKKQSYSAELRKRKGWKTELKVRRSVWCSMVGWFGFLGDGLVSDNMLRLCKEKVSHALF